MKQTGEHTGPQERPTLKAMFSVSWWLNRRKKKRQARIEQLKKDLAERKEQRGWTQDSEHL